MEKIKWVDVKIKHTDAKKVNKDLKEMLNNYNKEYELSGTLNQMIDDEDKMYKKAVYDRERALNKYLQDDIKEKNKFCFEMQQKTMKKNTIKKNKSHGNNINNKKIEGVPSINMNNTEKININNEDKKVNDGSDEEEKNEIQNKIDNENILAQNQPIPA